MNFPYQTSKEKKNKRLSGKEVFFWGITFRVMPFERVRHVIVEYMPLINWTIIFHNSKFEIQSFKNTQF